MSEWWTYRLSDFLLFSPRTYYRLFELHNMEWWPMHLLALAIGLMLGWLAWQRPSWMATLAFALLALCWWWVGWAFLSNRFEPVNWAARYYAYAFALQGVILAAAAVHQARTPRTYVHRQRIVLGWGLLLIGLVGLPLTGLLLGRPWLQTEVFGLAPDPTSLVTIAVLLLARARWPFNWLVWPIPLLWSFMSGATLWAMKAPDAWTLPALAVLAVLISAVSRRLESR